MRGYDDTWIQLKFVILGIWDAAYNYFLQLISRFFWQFITSAKEDMFSPLFLCLICVFAQDYTKKHWPDLHETWCGGVVRYGSGKIECWYRSALWSRYRILSPIFVVIRPVYFSLALTLTGIVFILQCLFWFLREHLMDFDGKKHHVHQGTDICVQFIAAGLNLKGLLGLSRCMCSAEFYFCSLHVWSTKCKSIAKNAAHI